MRDPRGIDKINYRPKIEYIKDDILTVDNIRDAVGGEAVDNTYSNTPGSATLEALDNNLVVIENIKSIIDDRLKDIRVQVTPSKYDGIIIDLVKTLNDGHKLINDGVITYNLYKEALQDELLMPIVYEWENYHSGINGEIEAEVLPYIVAIEQDVNGVLEVVEKTVLYDKPAANITELKEIEAKLVEQYNALSRKLDALYRAQDTDIPQVVSTRKQLDTIESRLKHNKAITSIAIEFASDVSMMLSEVEMVIDEKTKNKINEFGLKNAATMATKVQGDRSKLRLLVYQGFKAHREAIASKKEQFSSLFSREAKNKAFKSAITNSRLVLDVSLPVLNDLDFMDIGLEDQYSIMSIISGAEDMANKHKAAMLNMKNVLKATTKNARNNIKDISEKHITRTMYKNM